MSEEGGEKKPEAGDDAAPQPTEWAEARTAAFETRGWNEKSGTRQAASESRRSETALCVGTSDTAVMSYAAAVIYATTRSAPFQSAPGDGLRAGTLPEHFADLTPHQIIGTDLILDRAGTSEKFEFVERDEKSRYSSVGLGSGNADCLSLKFAHWAERGRFERDVLLRAIASKTLENVLVDHGDDVDLSRRCFETWLKNPRDPEFNHNLEPQPVLKEATGNLPDKINAMIVLDLWDLDWARAQQQSKSAPWVAPFIRLLTNFALEGHEVNLHVAVIGLRDHRFFLGADRSRRLRWREILQNVELMADPIESFLREDSHLIDALSAFVAASAPKNLCLTTPVFVEGLDAHGNTDPEGFIGEHRTPVYASQALMSLLASDWTLSVQQDLGSLLSRIWPAPPLYQSVS